MDLLKMLGGGKLNFEEIEKRALEAKQTQEQTLKELQEIRRLLGIVAHAAEVWMTKNQP